MHSLHKDCDLQFAIAPNRIPTTDIVEEGIFHLNDQAKHTVILSLINLRKDPDRVYVSADKGNCVVVIDRHQHRTEALSLLNDKQTYTILKSDRTG